MTVVWTQATLEDVFADLETRIRKLETGNAGTPAPTVFKMPLLPDDPLTGLVEGQAWVNSSINTFNVFYNGVNHRVSLSLG